MAKSIRNCLLLFFTLISFNTVLPQIKITEIPPSNRTYLSEHLTSAGASRDIILENSGWEVYSENGSGETVQITTPSSFENTEYIVYEKKFSVDPRILDGYNLRMRFLGINYNAQFFLNDLEIFTKPEGLFPFVLTLPHNLLSANEENKLVIRISHELNSYTSIPFSQRFLFPLNEGGILRDVFFEVTPPVFISDFNIAYTILDDLESVKFTLNSFIEKNDLFTDTLRNNYDLSVTLLDNDNNRVFIKNEYIGDQFISNNNLVIEDELKNIELWSPESPVEYRVKLELLRDDLLVDELTKKISFYRLESDEKKFTLNENKFDFKGVTYFNSTSETGTLASYEKMEKDLEAIKNCGFNSVRFAKAVPHPFLLSKCSELGLFAFIELPLNSLPEDFVEEKSFNERVERQLNSLLNYQKDFSSVAAVSIGSSFLGNSPVHFKFIEKFSRIIEQKSSLISYTSMVGIPEFSFEETDLIGIELFSRKINYYNELVSYAENNTDKKIFISEATYPNYKMSGTGYLHENTYEAQAKYFEDIINFSASRKLSGFFINTMFDYHGDFASLYTGYSEKRKYQMGLANSSNELNRISYKVVKAKLTSGERVTIPIGTREDDSPLFIIIVGLMLAVVMAILINSKKKFREDASRALLRPYNFFADIRDHRILSGLHTNILMLILAAAHALLLTNLLYYLKNNILVEKIIASFNMPGILDYISYLTWNPAAAFVHTFAYSLLLFALLSIVIKTAALFVKNRVYFNNIYYVVVWAFLPLSILLPIKLVLYRILVAEAVNLYIYIFLIVYFIWIYQRIIKGIYVIFDITRFSAYLYTGLITIFTAGGLILFFQLTDSTVSFIVLAFKQFQLI